MYGLLNCTFGVISFAQTGQIKAGAGDSLSVTPNVATSLSNTDGYGLYATDGGSIISRDGLVITSGSSATGLFAAEPDSVISWEGTRISTTGFRGRGIDAVRGAHITGFGTVVTSGDRAHAIQAGETNASAGPARVTLLPGTSVSTSGSGAYGLHAYSSSTIEGTVSIVTTGSGSFGAHAEKDSSVILADSTVETFGANAFGLLANTDGISNGTPYTPGHLTARATHVLTHGASAYGVYADTQATITLGDVTIETSGDSAAGLFAGRGGSIVSTGSITTRGNGAAGIAAGLSAAVDNPDQIQHSGHIVTSGNHAAGVDARNSARVDLTGSVITGGEEAYGAYVSSAALDLHAVSLATSGDNATGLVVETAATITGKADIITKGVSAHGAELSGGSTLALENATMTTSGAGASAVIVEGSNFAALTTVLRSGGDAIKITDTSTVSLINSSIFSTGDAITVDFASSDQHVDLNIGGSGQFESDTATLLRVSRTTQPAQTGAVTLLIAGKSNLSGSVYDNDSKTSGYTDVLLGGDVIWNGRVQGIRDFRSAGGNSQINFMQGTALYGDLTGIGTAFSFDVNGALIGGNAILQQSSSAQGGSAAAPVRVLGNMAVDQTSVQQGSWHITGGLDNQGIIAPGNGDDIGTITVDGNYSAGVNSVYQIQLNSAGLSDLIAVEGNASLAGSVALMTSQIGDISINNRYTILTASGGLGGTSFTDGINWMNSTGFLYLDPELSYDLNNVYLSLTRNTRSIADIATTPNQRAVGAVIDRGALSGALEHAFLLATDAHLVRSALSQLTGEAHQSVLTGLQQDASRPRDVISDRLREAFADDDTNLWMRGIGAQTEFGDRDGHYGVSQKAGGFFLGSDTMATRNLRLGGMVGYESSRFTVDELNSEADAQTWHVAAYGNWQQDAYRLGFGGAWSRHAIAMNRSLSLFSLTETLKSDYHANTAQIFAEAAYAATSGAFTAEPFSRLAYVRSERDSFDEDATGTIVKTPLHAEATDIDNLVTDLGMRLQYQWQLSADRKLSAVATPSWQHTFGDLKAQSLFSFAPDLAFPVVGAPMARDTISVDLGLTLDLNQDVSLAVNYGGRFGRATAENAVKGLAKLRF